MVAPALTASITLIDAGLLGYAPALELQQRLCRERQQDQVGDSLILLEHTPVITLGQSGGLEDILVTDAALQRRGVELFETNRGGRATFHGPGQLVAYPIIKLLDSDLHAYLWKLEEALLRLLTQWDIPAQREEHYPGVWVGSHKIAAVGVAVVGGVTMHGLALNVNTDLAFFELITPCGIRQRGVTSMQRELGSPLSMQAVKESLVRHFCEVFNLQGINGSIP
jgi:lipoate-protein ligase B